MSVATVSAIRRDGFAHDVVIGGHTLIVDEPESVGGADEGPSPTRMLAGALAGCTAITVEMYADRKGWELPDLRVDVEVIGNPIGGKASYAVTLNLPGGLTEDQTARLTTIAGKCPVHKLLIQETEITTDHRVG